MDRNVSFVIRSTVRMFVAVSDAWCGIVNGCPVMEGDDVTIGCYGQYDWLSYLLQYNPIVSLNSTIRFVDKAGTFRLIIPDVQRYPGPPAPENLTTSYTFNNVQAGQILNAECRIDFVFSKNTAYSGRQRYALNTLQWSSPISTPVNCEYYRFFCLGTLRKRGGILCGIVFV